MGGMVWYVLTSLAIIWSSFFMSMIIELGFARGWLRMLSIMWECSSDFLE